MNRLALALVLLSLLVAPQSKGVIEDPVQSYLDNLSVVGGVSDILLDDLLLRFDLDLNNDGKKEVLLSLVRNRNGKQGNLWEVYTPSLSGYSNVGMITFSGSRFFLGPLEDGKFGLANFAPGGAGEGIMWGYVFNGVGFEQIKLGEVVLNRETMKLEGEEIVEKFLGEEAINGSETVSMIAASDLAEKYNIQVEEMTYQEALQQPLSSNEPFEKVYQLAQVSQPTPPSKPKKSIDPPEAGQQQPASFPWLWIGASVVCAGVLAFLVFQRHRA